MSLKDIKGQPFAVKLLKRAVKSNRLAGTYLFYGPSGVGKEFTAREFAKSLNCYVEDEDNCNKCSSCIRIEQNKHPDILLVYPIGKKRQIRIEHIRQLQKFVSMKPYEGRTKIVIIQDAHTLNIESGNALLKTLEEPPPGSIIILITHSPETLLPTIKSRAQDVQFFYLSEEVIAELLESKMKLSCKDAVFYSQLGMGSLSRALSFMNEDIFKQRKLILDKLAEGRFKNIKSLIDFVDEIQEGLERFKEGITEQVENVEDDTVLDTDAIIAGEYRKRVEEILSLILSWYRDILIFKNIQKESAIINKDYINRIEFWRDKLDVTGLTKRIEVLDKIREALARQISIKFLLQIMFMQLEMI